jgi:hypothetical protein
MLSSYCCSITCLKYLRVLNVPLKESCVVFIIQKRNIVAFSFKCFIWVDLAHAHTMLWLWTSNLKPLWSFSFWLVISLYALINNVLSLCMIMAVIARWIGRSNTEYELYLCIQLPKNQSLPMCPPYLPINIISIPSIFIMFSSIFQIKCLLWEN